MKKVFLTIISVLLASTCVNASRTEMMVRNTFCSTGIDTRGCPDGQNV